LTANVALALEREDLAGDFKREVERLLGGKAS
jgi:UTP--glucose-1-phosphate uridylyltransferase